MARIFGWAADNSGCGYYRLRLPLAQLAAQGGHQVLVDARMPDQWWHDAQVIVGQRVFKPAPSQRWQQLAKDGRFLVMELDDDLFNIDPSSTAFSYYNQPGAQQRLRDNIAAASRVTVSTPALAERIEPLNPEVWVLPNMIPGWLLEPSCCPPGHPVPGAGSQFKDGQARGQDGAIGDTGISPPPVILGWAGSDTHRIDWQDLARPIARLVTQTPNLVLHLRGWCPPGLPGPIPIPRYRFSPWIEPVEDYLRSLDFQIGLAPMRPHVFNACKSEIRLLELAARAIPAVVSDYGAYREHIVPRVTALSFRLPHQAVAHVRRLAADPAMRDEIGRAARSWAATRTIERNWQLWEKALTP